MVRMFDQHAIRPARSLDGFWDFVTAAERRDRRRLPTTYSRRIRVPSVWESLPGLETYRGKAWLRTAFDTGDARAIRLVFGGVSHTGTVFVDGREAGRHEDAFTPWDVVVAGLKPGRHELVVEVDNSFGEHAALHIENDYYSYGGITRPVELQAVDAIYIERVLATPRRWRGTWRLDVRVRLRNLVTVPLRRQVVLELDGQALDLGVVEVAAQARQDVSGVLAADDVTAWSAEAPALYRLHTRLLDGDVIADDLIERIGFREVRVRGRKLLLNGEPLRLRGYNRHEDHPQFGNALPVEAMITDLELLRDLGCNTVRTCHYPNDHRFIDLCDELGVYVWEESHARSVDFKHPAFDRQIEASTREMVDWHFNAPSIVIWGCLNECDSITPAGRAVHARVLRQLRELDGSRPVTFASNKAEQDSCLDLVDIVAWNRYDAWYHGGLDDVPKALRQALRWLHSPASGGMGKPVILSEFGAGGIYGCRQRQAAKWSEEYQCECLDACLREYLYHPDVIGALIWQFCDCRVSESYWGGRPRTFNNKGTLDEYRRPKLAYATVKHRMHAAQAAFEKGG